MTKSSVVARISHISPLLSEGWQHPPWKNPEKAKLWMSFLAILGDAWAQGASHAANTAHNGKCFLDWPKGIGKTWFSRQIPHATHTNHAFGGICGKKCLKLDNHHVAKCKWLEKSLAISRVPHINKNKENQHTWSTQLKSIGRLVDPQIPPPQTSTTTKHTPKK